MAVETQVAGSGQGLTWGSAFGLNAVSGVPYTWSIPSGILIDNSSALDMYADLSYNFPAASWPGGFFLWFLMPQNQDGSSYGNSDGAGGDSLPIQYQCGYSIAPVTSGVQEGIVTGILLPPGKFIFQFNNWSGITIPSSIVGSSTINYRTYNRSVI